MKKDIERKIHRNILLVYIFIALAAGVMLKYFYDLRETLDEQRHHIEQYHDLFTLANGLIYSVNQAQASGNLYITTQGRSHLTRMRSQIATVEQQIDSLVVLSGEPEQVSTLREIGLLLRQKERIISRMNFEMPEYNPLDSISERLRSYEIVPARDTVTILTTSVMDTVITPPEKKNFWRRLKNVFSPDDDMADTTILVKTYQRDSVMTVQRADSVILTEVVGTVAETANAVYAESLSRIGRSISRLLQTDQEITAQISGLVDNFYRGTLDTTLEQIHRSEDTIRRNYTYSIVGIVGSLLLTLLVVILILGDVNRGYRARLALQEANRRIRDIMESRHRLLLSVSHDIKTPLTSILGYAEAWSGEPQPEVTAEELSSVIGSGRYIHSLVENLLEFSALEQGKLLADPRPFPAALLFRELTDMFAPLARRKQLTFEVSIELDSGLYLYSDSLKIRQIAANLLSNAVKYTVRGSVGLRVWYREQELSVEVMDTGVGLLPEEMERVFEPFRRVDRNNRLASGNGFGMYVVKGLTELLGGKISGESEPGQGTRFTVTLPATETTPDAAPLVRSILVVDDEPLILSVFEKMLAATPSRVTCCRRPEAFAEYLSDPQRFSLVVTDMEMGEVTGEDILRIVKAAAPTLPVVVMSGRGDLTREKVYALGFDGFLPKPFTSAGIRALLGEDFSLHADLTSLREMYADDHEGLQELLETFVVSTEANLDLLKGYVAKDKFEAVQALCHRMLPMFLQLEAREPAAILQKMDALRGAAPEDCPSWKEEIEKLIESTGRLLRQIRSRWSLKG